MADITLPRANQAIINLKDGPQGNAGTATRELYNFFRQLSTLTDNAELQAEIDAIIARLDEIGSGTFEIKGNYSVRVVGSPASGVVSLLLQGDSANPGNSFYYGTDDSGQKAFWPILNPYADYLVDGDGNYLTDNDGNYLVAQDGYPIPWEYGGTGENNTTGAGFVHVAGPLETITGGKRFNGTVGINADGAANTGLQIISTTGYEHGIEVISDTPGTQPDITCTAYGTNGGGIFHGRMANGTMALPTAIISGDIYAGYGGRPFRSNGTFASSSPVSTHFVAKETQTATAMGGCYRILTTPAGSVTRTIRLVASDKDDVVFGDVDSQPDSSLDNRGTAVVRAASAEHVLYTYAGAGLTAGLRALCASGTQSSPAATQSGQGVFVGLGGHTGSAYSSGTQALVSLVATQNWTGSVRGAQVVISTTPNGSTTRADRVWVTDTGDVGIGTATTNPLANTDLNVMVSAATSGDRLARINMQGSRTSANAPYATFDFYHQTTRVSQFVAIRGASGAAAGGYYFSTKSNAGSLTTAFAVTESQNVNVASIVNDANSGGMVGGIYVANVGTAPTGAPTAGGVIYVEAGALKYRGSSGTITVLAPA